MKTTYTNISGLNFIIVKFDHRTPKGNFYLIRFLKSGYEKVASMSDILRGKVKDLLAPSVAGVDYRGVGRDDLKSNSRTYRVWHNMINRCYNVNSTEYPHYGAVNTTVCERWHCFVNFANDIENIEGYDEDLFEENLIQLDKDGKQMFSQAKVYSPETFQFITPYQNGQLVERERISITSVSPQGVEESWDSVSEFLKYHPSMKRAGVYKCLSKHLYTYRGWRFGYCNDYRKPDESE